MSRLRFEEALQDLINKYSRENGSDTPDFILASYLDRCLSTFDITVRRREHWYRSESVPEEEVERVG